MGAGDEGESLRNHHPADEDEMGSCNVQTHHININLALLSKPPECLEYVVVHEMTHILEASHNQRFWGFMTKFYPDWKRVRKYLSDETVD